MRGLSKHGRQLRRLFQIRSVLPQAVPSVLTAQQCRCNASSSNAFSPGASSIDAEAIRADMLARQPQIYRDMMYPINSHLLTETLSDFLPEECHKKQQIPREVVYHEKSDCLKKAEPPVLPAGHHLLYFPLHLRNSELCPDGTDPYYSPRDIQFTRRVWAGGSIQGFRGMSLDENLAVCLERIEDVNVRGSPGTEKIFVDVLREYISQADFRDRFDLDSMQLRPHDNLSNPRAVPSAGPRLERDLCEHNSKGITERRTLVFMRNLSDEERAINLKTEQRIVKPPNKSDYSVTLTPTPTLLFHYSALTYNAHRIHLDRSYCREVEGHRDLLVHGPLSLTLMLSVLQSQLADDKSQYEFINSIDYRNLAPLYVGQPMRICAALQKPQHSITDKTKGSGDGSEVVAGGDGEGVEVERKKWDVWIENQDGGLCVRGTAETVKRSVRPP
ncbi:hypothetical protein F4861DRAFT_538612 [Xylaria intraflava]|nr:hypothetical protein F4861DRAFT_538612 [Xylaria intraflava]